MNELAIPSNVIDITETVNYSVDRYLGILDWLAANVGQHVKKGNDYSVMVMDADYLQMYRMFGIGWHLDIKRDFETKPQYFLSIYNDYRVVEFKLTWL